MFEKYISEVPCPKCGKDVEVEIHESSDGGHEDAYCRCVSCDYVKWEEGPDY